MRPRILSPLTYVELGESKDQGYVSYVSLRIAQTLNNKYLKSHKFEKIAYGLKYSMRRKDLINLMPYCLLLLVGYLSPHIFPSLYRFSLSIYSSFPLFSHLLLSFLLISALHSSPLPLLSHAINVNVGRKSCKQDHCCFPTCPETTDME